MCLEEVLNPDNPSETVHDILLKKHAQKQPLKEASLVNPNTPVTDPHSIIFERIDSQLIRSTVLKMNGAAGPSAWTHQHGNECVLHANQSQLTYVMP